ncbi:lasso peptide biosynthesis B2 protein [Brevundimonas diminuta]|uniref:lasso peptide biosynthesis B2 protein n=1 Tax=Brevundimonas diminuta TaxID=293 RepID=UPI00209735D3|nr:lasso peptide biosynthesis B2 protein [Brevundimonas diminuta]MCO8018706.1 lasso peptide biosynthesis B2 protein [Brevundimonas diminuta]MCO8020442.1 lasso peptide biosynthesis B2 protein [Brevundimonas diminuta]
MPTLWLQRNVHTAQIATDIVVLDVEADRYSCLLGAALYVRLGQNGRLEAANEDVAGALEAAGFATRSPLSTSHMPPTPANRELSMVSSTSRIETVRASLAFLAAKWIFKDKTLGELIRFHDAVRRRSDPIAEPRLSEFVSAARRARPWTPFEGECLQRSFQLRCYLASHGVAVDWIFGVRTWPFCAHCWLQFDDIVVGDRLDRVARYTPILKA